MGVDDYNWRPITFQGITFPASLMAISVLESLLQVDDELGEWLWRFTICCGVNKTAPAHLCEKYARQAIDLMIQHRPRVLDGIRERLGEHGFDAEITYREWITSLQQIASLSKAAGGECVWSALLHPKDPIQNATDLEKLLTSLNRAKPPP